MNHLSRIITILAALWSVAVGIPPNAMGQNRMERLPLEKPEDVGFRSDTLALIDEVVEAGIAADKMSGCVVAIGRQGKLAFLRAYGHRQRFPTAERMQTDTVFDMASLTKPIATATSVMMLWQEGKIQLTDKLASHIPEFACNGKDDISILQLLTHQAGLIPDNPLSDYRDGAKQALNQIFAINTIAKPGTKFIYSDVGYILLAELVSRISGKNVHQFSQQHFFKPLQMTDSGYLPNRRIQARCATNDRRGSDGNWIKGTVHDPRAYQLGGVAGHAGLFSTAEDLAVFAQMFLNGGQIHGRRILKRETIQIMTSGRPVSSGVFALGWDKQTGFSSNRAPALSDSAYGHGGFTGTVLWIDPQLDLFYIVLSNRLHPDGKGAINKIAGQIGSLAAAARNPEFGAKDESFDLRQVSTGLDVLASNDFERLKGLSVGLITNHTGVDRQGRGNVELMHNSPNVTLTALFSPEHGMEGKGDGTVADAIDPDTGLPIRSLYGASRQPTEQQLADIDALVFDVQDIGTRFYTYISTMGLAMQAAAKHQKRFYVLDRPNPIGGRVVGGAMLDDDKRSFVGFHRLPVRHGMTVGELARMFKAELQLELDLQIVELQGWQRNQWFDQTGLWWVNPSPNIRCLNQAMLYPGVGLLEMTNLSVGRGTDQPFEIIGAPWIQGKALGRELSLLNLPGVTFTPTKFKPTTSRFADEECEGVNIAITNRNTFDADRLGLALATVLRKLYPDDWRFENYNRLLGNDKTWRAINTQQSIDEITDAQQVELLSFHQRRLKYLIYD